MATNNNSRTQSPPQPTHHATIPPPEPGSDQDRNDADNEHTPPHSYTHPNHHISLAPPNPHNGEGPSDPNRPSRRTTSILSLPRQPYSDPSLPLTAPRGHLERRIFHLTVSLRPHRTALNRLFSSSHASPPNVLSRREILDARELVQAILTTYQTWEFQNPWLPTQWLHTVSAIYLLERMGYTFRSEAEREALRAWVFMMGRQHVREYEAWWGLWFALAGPPTHDGWDEDLEV